MIHEGLLDEAALEQISDQAKAEAKAAVAFAENGSIPEIPDIGRDVYWETDHDAERSRIGRHFFD